jgi:hypothetical protein
VVVLLVVRGAWLNVRVFPLRLATGRAAVEEFERERARQDRLEIWFL